jgi:cytochrome c biogenesis protein CcmG/thiol:disulfide interchange protein DsbE
MGAQALSLALVAGLLGLLVWKVAHQVGNSTVAAAVADGKRPTAPQFELPRLDRDGTLRSSSLVGKVQVVNFWASWCGPCRDEAALLEQAWRQWRVRGLVVVGVDHQDFSGDARAFLRKFATTYPAVQDRGDKLYRKYGATGVPETFFLDRDGNVVSHVPGAVTRDSLQDGILEAFGT